MPDLGILNTLIAMVIVILVLSLIVQSLQTLVKKFFKLKSRTILYSLEDLFQTITRPAAGAEAAGGRRPNQLVQDVLDRLREMGRETLLGRPMLDSLAKGDLLKVLTRVEAESLLPGAVRSFQAVLGAADQLKAELAGVKVELLEGDASARFAALQASLMPLVHDLEALAGGGNINPKVLLGDLYSLRQIKVADVLGILGDVQQRVGRDLAAAGAADDAAQKTFADAQAAGDQARIEAARGRAQEARYTLEGLRGVSAGLRRVAEQIARLGRSFDAAFAPLRERLEQAEVWYDTVMQGFEERYTRHMRTVALALSVIVVVVLNANFFTVYQAMSNPERAAAVSDQGQNVLDQSPQATGAAGGTAAGQPSPAGGGTAVAELQDQARQTQGYVDTYKSFGIAPLTRQQVSNFFRGAYRPRDLVGTFVGWLIMVVLLSAGAPFWQDTLESLFGLKNLLRQRSDTQNVEGERGGQPKP